MVASFQARLTGLLAFVMRCLGASLWAATEPLRALALRQRWVQAIEPWHSEGYRVTLREKLEP